MKRTLKNSKILLLVIPLLSLFSCASKKSLTYFQGGLQSELKYVIDTTYAPIIQANDLLSINITSVSPEVSKYFSFNESAGTESGYVVDRSGNIQLPLVGDLHLAGFTADQAREIVKIRLEKYLINPTVKLNIKNFSVTFLGEVNKPGVYSVANEKVTLTEALGMAGDLTDFGMRKNVMVIREINGRKEFASVDITSRDFFSSPYYNLHPNDIVYVQASGQKRYQLSTAYFQLVQTLLYVFTLAFTIASVTK